MSEQDGLAGIVEFSRPDRNPERPKPLDWQEYQDRVLAGWYDLLSREPNESEVQYFLELHPAMIPEGAVTSARAAITTPRWLLCSGRPS